MGPGIARLAVDLPIGLGNRAGIEGGRVSVVVGDDGTGMPDPVPAGSSGGGFGLTLVSLLATQLRADIARESDGGTVVRLSFEL